VLKKGQRSWGSELRHASADFASTAVVISCHICVLWFPWIELNSPNHGKLFCWANSWTHLNMAVWMSSPFATSLMSELLSLDHITNVSLSIGQLSCLSSAQVIPISWHLLPPFPCLIVSVVLYCHWGFMRPLVFSGSSLDFQNCFANICFYMVLSLLLNAKSLCSGQICKQFLWPQPTSRLKITSFCATIQSLFRGQAYCGFMGVSFGTFWGILSAVHWRT